MVGSIQQVRPAELKVPSSSLSTSFAGRMAGVIAIQRSGQPGADGADFGFVVNLPSAMLQAF